MKEGWWNEDYYVLFDESEHEQLTRQYDLHRHLPGYTVVGLKGWDDFILRDAQKTLFVVPTVPIDPQYLEAMATPPAPDAFEADPECAGKIKWWITPLVFGGDPDNETNSTWLSLAKHTELVRWWNDKYQELKSQG